jgi:hypothetical protein
MVVQNTPAPERSLQQRMAALENANRIRIARAKLKMDVKAGEKSVMDLIAEPPEYIHSMKLFNLLLSAPKIGRVKANKILNYCRISPSKTVGGLSDRQRKEILSLLYR